MPHPKASSFLPLALAGLLCAIHFSDAATITIVNLDGAGEGFNDPTAATPIDGNSGTTVGQQRLKVFQRAAQIWGAKLSSSITIQVGAQFNALSCGVSSGVLGSAGANNFIRDFAGAPVAGTWYPVALANALAGTDFDPGGRDIDAQFNSNIGTAGCLPTLSWYYGLVGSPPSGGIKLLDVVLHELAHGLGFLSLVDLTTGAKALGFDDAYMRHLEDHSTGEIYPNMSNGERINANKDTGDLHWVGTNVTNNSSFLISGRHASGHVEMYAPNPVEPGSSVSHFSTSLSPNELMEPAINSTMNRTLTSFLMKDIGWTTFAEVSTVIARRVFYNNSAWDLNNAAANTNDDLAIATDKSALLPGGTATVANYTSYSRGLNGVMVDISIVPSNLTSADFTFRIGNDNVPSGWSAAPAPTSISVRIGEGTGGSDRVTLIWADNAIQGKWLQVTVKANANTGLATDSVFYFGNAIGETGNTTANAAVNGIDEARVRSNPSGSASITSLFDINRDKLVNSADETQVRSFNTTSSTMLQLVVLPSSLVAGLDAGLVLQRSSAGELFMEYTRPEGSRVEAADSLGGPWELLREETTVTGPDGLTRGRVLIDRPARFFRMVRQ